MRIEKVIIKKFGPLNNALWNINTSNNIVFICGPHGSGKSSLINSIDYSLSRMFLGSDSTTIFPIWLNLEEFNAKITLNSNCSDDKKLIGNKYEYAYPTYYNIDHIRQKYLGKIVPYACIKPNSFIDSAALHNKHVFYRATSCFAQ